LLQAGKDGLSVLTVNLDKPTGYGRIVRDTAGNMVSIVEEKDATAEQKAICEVNTGIMAIPTARLADWLGKLKNDNAQGEYYLTDIVALAVAEGLPVRTAQPEGEWEVLGVNSKVQLAELERQHQRNLADQLLVAGVRWPIRRASMCVANCAMAAMWPSTSAASSRARSSWRCGRGRPLLRAEERQGRRRYAHCRLLPFRGCGDRPGRRARPLRPPAAGHRTRPRGAHRQLRRGQEEQDRRAVQGQSPGLHRRRRDRPARQCRRRYHHLQLRRRQQAPDGDRG
jgi:hypothetical protein